MGGANEDEFVDGLSTGVQEDHTLTPHYSPLATSQMAPVFPASSKGPPLPSPPDGYPQLPSLHHAHTTLGGSHPHYSHPNSDREHWQQMDPPIDGLLEDGDSTLQVDLEFLQSATLQDEDFLRQLYLRCGRDLERTMDVALVHTQDDTSDYGSEERHAYSGGSDPEMDSNTESEFLYVSPRVDVTEEGEEEEVGPAMEVPEDSNLVLRLSTTMATHLQQLFGEVDKTLFSDGTCPSACEYVP